MAKPSSWRPRATNELVVPAALGLLVLYAIVAWAVDAVQRVPTASAPGGSALLTVSANASYADVLAGVTNLGMRLAGNNCVEDTIASARVAPGIRLAAAAQEDSFADRHLLLVAPTVLAPPDWAARLASLPGVTDVNPRAIWHCYGLDGTWLDRLRYAPLAARPTILHFAGGTTYDDALRAASDLGLRLADPCYETALAHGKHPAWHTAGQQDAYAASDDLVVAPTILTPDDWMGRLAGGVVPGPVVACVAG